MGWLARSGVVWACLAVVGCGGAQPAATPKNKDTNDPDAARAAYRAAVVAELDGDALVARRGLLALAADHPETPHGRHAAHMLDSAGQAAMLVGMLASMGMPGMLGFLERMETAAAPTPPLDPDPAARVYSTDEPAASDGDGQAAR